MHNTLKSKKISPVGYAGLIELFSIEAIPHYRLSYILAQGSPGNSMEEGIEIHCYPKKYFLKDFNNPLHHLEFALKYDGLNLEILRAVFEKIEPKKIEDHVQSQPTSKWARKIWYLYEWLTGRTLLIEDANEGSYSLLLDPTEYYTASAIRSRRHYVDDNLLGNRLFCPIVRRTPELQQWQDKDFSSIAIQLINESDPAIVARAINYLYVKETFSSYKIEREQPNLARSKRFIDALQHAGKISALSKKSLIELQNLIVDPRFANNDYRNFQNYIGSEARLDAPSLLIDYIPPKPEDVEPLMAGWLDSLQRMIKSDLHPVIAAAASSFGFVFIHPFEDGNGRIHRFLIHYLFAQSGFVPKNMIFPISAVILQDMASYDSLLESFSKPLMQLIKNYEINFQGALQVNDKTADYYRYLDYTRFAGFLFACVEKTINTEFKNEIAFVAHYDQTKEALQKIVDMPDRNIDLFIQLVLQNRGTLSAKKRQSHFASLTENEIQQMEAVVQEKMAIRNPS
ncbi:MAG: hypothetical protein HW387_864 [Parachlamydiales bacterium]|nr:hypothetical protein [Parachlamydiales bacterium]